MKGIDVEPWNVIEEPPVHRKKPLLPMEGKTMPMTLVIASP